jgi:uncharacterized membrane protein
MGTTQFENLMPRLYAVETDLGAIRQDLRAAIAAARAGLLVEPDAAAETAESTAQVAGTLPIPEPEDLAAEPAWKAVVGAGDLESLLAGRWLHVVGLLLVFIGSAFFLKVAFDHDWITPVLRVVLGLVAGAVAMVFAQRLASKGQLYFSEGITALGAGIEFLSLYACNALFHLASPALVLAGMVAVNAVIASLAWRRHSERLGILAAIGGFLAPMLAGTQSADQWMLAGYIGMLDVGLLLLAELVESRVIAPLALAGTMLYALGSFSSAHSLDDMQRAIIYMCLYATFAFAGWIVTKRRGTLVHPSQPIAGGIALGALFVGLETSLSPEHRTVLAAMLLGLTVAHLGMAIILKSRYNSWLAVAALTFAIPAAFERAVLVNIAWAAEAAVLTTAGMRFRDNVLNVAGLGLLALAVARDAFSYTSYADIRYVSTNPILNERFAACAAAFAATYVSARAIDVLGIAEYDSILVRVLRTAGHAIALLALSAEAWNTVAHYGGTSQASSAALSVLWAIFAAILVGCGLRKADSFMRWEGLALIILTVAKVLLLDLSFLDLGYRVISAVLVGVALIGISYVYQRRLPKERAQS